ncbi:DUF4982 domain-containing protein, partial [Ructibacterium gallinarum]
RKLDNTRYIVAAVSNDPDIATVYDELDAIGINYNLDKYDKIHAKYPKKPIFSSECCATGTTRGWYEDNCAERAFLSAYDKDTTNWFLGREKTWKFMCERKWVLGEYQWIAFEHRGESAWPRLCSQAGAIDLFLQKKDAFYQNQSHWLDPCRPMVHLLPHWNFQEREGEKIRVVAYTNCEELELYLNNKSIGKQCIERYGHGEWLVEYEAGNLRCEARINGKTVCEEMCETTDKAEKLNLRMENDVKANGKDIAIITCYCTDAAGREVPDATPYVSFFTNQLGKVIATGSDITDHNPVNFPDRKMRAGKISVAIQVGKEKGELKVYAVAENLRSTVLTIMLK